MRLNNLQILPSGELVSIVTRNGKIAAIEKKPGSGNRLQEAALVFPGLINSHDHLDFNCFPALGEEVFANYREWGNSLHSKYKEEIRKVLDIPAQLRTTYGLYKNLLNGFTTVVQHGSCQGLSKPFLNIVSNNQDLHSVGFQPNWKLRLNNPFRPGTYVLHIGEGTDRLSQSEIDELIKWNRLKRSLVGVHAVAMTASQAGAFKAIVWCPGSNQFMLEKQPAIGALKNKTVVLFGTDSTLSASWNAWDQLRLAREQGGLDDEELFRTMTTGAAKTWQLNAGALLPGMPADFVIAKNKDGHDKWNSFYSTAPEDILLVMVRGEPLLFDEACPGLEHIDRSKYCAVCIGTAIKFIKGDLPDLAKRIRHYYPDMSFPFSILSPGTSVLC